MWGLYFKMLLRNIFGFIQIQSCFGTFTRMSWTVYQQFIIFLLSKCAAVSTQTGLVTCLKKELFWQKNNEKIFIKIKTFVAFAFWSKSKAVSSVECSSKTDKRHHNIPINHECCALVKDEYEDRPHQNVTRNAQSTFL